MIFALCQKCHGERAKGKRGVLTFASFASFPKTAIIFTMKTKTFQKNKGRWIMPSIVIIDNRNHDKIKVEGKFDWKMGVWRIKVKLK